MLIDATMLVNAGWMAKDRAVNKAKSIGKECIDAYRVENVFPKEQGVSVVMWFMVDSEKRIMEIKDEILATKGVRGLQLKLSVRS